ncbi:MAG: ARMT1-like domain-containing protein [Verrucomicrobiota bacterium JB024]|nr:ARMT1-like domain-containing protein [Verrucomicrobiota bacterium JB024]
MKTTIDCFSCFIRQGLQAARLAGASERQQDLVVRAIMGHLLAGDPDESPVELARAVQRIVREITGRSDPYDEIKARSNAQAATWLKTLEKRPASPADPLEHAVRLAVAGNIIDYGPQAAFDLEATLERCLSQRFAIDRLPMLRERLKHARTLAYLADNAGEIVFDRLLLTQLLKEFPLEKVLFVVREEVFLNDALTADAEIVGIRALDRVELVQMGPGKPASDAPSRAVWERLTHCDVRLAKGQANAECFDTEPDFFLLFMVKCEMVAQALTSKNRGQIRLGDLVLAHTGVDTD